MAEAAAGAVQIVLQSFDGGALTAIQPTVIAQGAVFILVQADRLALANTVMTLCIRVRIPIPAAATTKQLRRG